LRLLRAGPFSSVKSTENSQSELPG
jgi:hypothetical protein